MKKNKEQMPHENRNEDIRLAEGCKKKNADSQKRLFEKYYGLMLTICLRYTRSREDARDILQEGFAKAFANIDQYRFEQPLFYWLRSIMVNTAIDRYRSESKKPVPEDLDDNYIQGNLDDEITEHFNTEHILEAIQSLPDSARKTFNLFVIEGYSHKEISRKLNVSEGTCRSQLNYAKKLLRDKLASSQNSTMNNRSLSKNKK